MICYSVYGKSKAFQLSFSNITFTRYKTQPQTIPTRTKFILIRSLNTNANDTANTIGNINTDITSPKPSSYEVGLHKIQNTKDIGGLIGLWKTLEREDAFNPNYSLFLDSFLNRSLKINQGGQLPTLILKWILRNDANSNLNPPLSSLRQDFWMKLLKGLAFEDKLKDIKKLNHFLQKHSILLGTYYYMIVLRLCSKLKEHPFGVALVEQLLSSNIDLSKNGRLVTSVINFYIRCNELTKAREIFNELKGRGVCFDVISWNILLIGYAQSNLMEEASSIFEEMKRDGVKPNYITLSSMLSGYSRQGNPRKAFVFFELLLDTVTEENWISLILGYIECGEMKEAIGLLNEMIKSGTKTKDLKWNLLLNKLIDKGDTQNTLQIFNTILLNGFQSDLIMNSKIIKSLLIAEQYPQAIQLYLHLNKGNGMELHDRVCISLLQHYLQRGQFDKITSLLNALQGEKVFWPGLYVWNTLLEMFSAKLNLNVLLKIKEYMKEMNLTPNVLTWNPLIECYVHINMQEALLQLDLMKEAGVRPNQQTWNILLSGFKRHLKDEQKAIETLKEKGYLPPNQSQHKQNTS